MKNKMIFLFASTFILINHHVILGMSQNKAVISPMPQKNRSTFTFSNNIHAPWTVSSIDGRRQVGHKLAIILSSIMVTATNTNVVHAAQGAAEYDLEFYMRDLVQGNRREGNVQPSSPPKSPTPRTLTGNNFIDLIFNDACDNNCLAVSQLASITHTPPQIISQQVDALRSKVYKAFQNKNAWTRTSVTDEYYFDLTAYCLFRVAADLIPTNYALRDQYIRTIGNILYQQTNITGFTNTTKPLPLSQSTTHLIKIMDIFNSSRYVDTYRIQRDTSSSIDAVNTPLDIFDSFDDEDIQNGRSVNLLISLIRPATLGSSLQLTAENSRFTPEFVAPTVAAMWKDLCHVSTEYETYYVDNTYRPNPKDFFPDEVLIQFTIKPNIK